MAAFLLCSAAAKADDLADARVAFEARNYQAAARFWTAAAARGSAEAELQLGLLSDLGLGQARDPGTAFLHYRRAAELGLPEAAFNVGVMLDAGTGVGQDSVAAGVWYARAALAGSARAAFNLGLLYRDGSGVPSNPDLAAYWLAIAAENLPAAKEALNSLPPRNPGPISAPLPLSAARIEGQAMADLVWTATSGPGGSTFVVQVLTDGDASPSLWVGETPGSALRVPAAGALAWRVARVDPASNRYLATRWQRQPGGVAGNDPRGLVTIAVNPGDDRAAELARLLTEPLRGGGIAITIAIRSRPATESSVLYRYADDQALARDIADFLPGMRNVAVSQSADLSAGPGEVVVNLVLSPEDGQDRDPDSPPPAPE